jgi:two-component system sensor histidine kinase KdpD
MDIDTLLLRRPEVVIVDELAHTNVPGSRNQKRYEDVEELLNAGINVISALNIQHLESLAGIVEEATGVEIHERVPDSFLRIADEVVNIDLPADELIQRLKDGKIYASDKVEIALRNFFQRENLLKLRELALREVANLLERKIDVEVAQPGKKQLEKILVCISSNSNRAKELIRKSARLAERLDAMWYVLYVETPSENPDTINLSLQRHLINNLQTATELGANVHKLKSGNIPDAILQFAKEKEISRLVIGRPSQNVWTKFFKTDLLTQLLSKTEGEDIDIEIIA